MRPTPTPFLPLLPLLLLHHLVLYWLSIGALLLHHPVLYWYFFGALLVLYWCTILCSVAVLSAALFWQLVLRSPSQSPK